MPSAQTPNGMPASRAVVTALGQETARTMCRFQVRRRQKAHRALCKKTPAHPRRGGYYAEFLILGALSAREAVERSETEGAIGLPRRCEADAWEEEVSPPAKIAWRLLREDKRKRRYFVRLFPFVQILFCRDSAGRAAILASAAVDADIGIDDIRRIAGSDRIHGASIGAGAAGDAGVGDLVSHLDYLPSKSYWYYITVCAVRKGL